MSGKIIRDMPFDTYFLTPAVSSHGLATARKSLLRYKHEQEVTTSVPDTEAFHFGRAAHVGFLERKPFDKRYVVRPDFATKPTWNKKPENYTDHEKMWVAIDEMAKESGREVLSAEAGIKIRRMVDTLDQDLTIKRIYADSIFEVSLFWTDELSGLPCKARLDALNPHLLLVWDLKTALSAHPDDFKWAAKNNGYIHQLAWYRRAARACGVEVQHTMLVAIEKEEPYDYAFYMPEEDELAFADAQNDKVLSDIAQAKRTNIYVGYSKEVQPLRVGLVKQTETQGEIVC
jgi:hypothetical protein